MTTPPATPSPTGASRTGASPSGASPNGAAAAGASPTGAGAGGAGKSSQVAALQGALAAEHAAVYGYGVVGAMTSGAQRAAARTDWSAHQIARDNLEAMLTTLGADPVAASAAYQLPFAVTSGKSAARLAAALEDGVTRAYLGVVAVTDTKLRTFGAQAMQTAAARALAWSGTTHAFPGMPGAQP